MGREPDAGDEEGGESSKNTEPSLQLLDLFILRKYDFPMSEFVQALLQHDLKALRSIPKSDLHNHGMMGGKLRSIEKFYGKKLEKFNQGSNGVEGINDWLGRIYQPVLEHPGAFRAAIEAAFGQAISDGVTVLEMSIDLQLGRMLKLSPENIIAVLREVHQETAPEITFRPELGISRRMSVRSVLTTIGPYFDSGYFRSVDLYDIEDHQPASNFAALYRFAKDNGLKCKAHAGEFGDAESVRETAETLGLEEVQHGIGAAQSHDVMKWLASNHIRLNVCPESNIVLKRVKSYKTHPIRILYDHGVKVTVNTDDVMLFDQGNSEQFLRLYKSGLFSAQELEEIRLNGF
jgi:adenosine deaminase